MHLWGRYPICLITIWEQSYLDATPCGQFRSGINCICRLPIGRLNLEVKTNPFFFFRLSNKAAIVFPMPTSGRFRKGLQPVICRVYGKVFHKIRLDEVLPPLAGARGMVSGPLFCLHTCRCSFWQMAARVENTWKAPAGAGRSNCSFADQAFGTRRDRLWSRHRRDNIQWNLICGRHTSAHRYAALRALNSVGLAGSLAVCNLLLPTAFQFPTQNPGNLVRGIKNTCNSWQRETCY